MSDNWNAEEIRAVEMFAKKTLPKLRRLQSVVEQQIKIAYERKLDDVLQRLQRMELILGAAVDKKCFGILDTYIHTQAQTSL